MRFLKTASRLHHFFGKNIKKTSKPSISMHCQHDIFKPNSYLNCNIYYTNFNVQHLVLRTICLRLQAVNKKYCSNVQLHKDAVKKKYRIHAQR